MPHTILKVPGYSVSMGSELGWTEAIIELLKAADSPMHYVDIAEKIYELGLRDL